MSAATATLPSQDDIERAVRVLVRPSDAPLRGAFTRRALRAVACLSRQMGEASLREAVSAPSDYGVLLTALESEPGLAALKPDDPLAEARLRGIVARQRLLTAEGGTLSVQEVASLLNISRQAAYKRYRAGRLLAVDYGRHGLGFPAWQLVPGGVLPGLEETLAALARLDPWMKFAFFLEENIATDGKTPLAALRKGRLNDVLRAAELHGKHGAV
ncbi:MAG TPA: helix-turn-helix domain-containing protein [Thermoanaerobaculia bacterium]